MIERAPAPPRLNGAQRLWLLELGLDRPMVARLMPGNPKIAARGAAAAIGGAQASVEAGAAGLDGRAQASAALAALRRASGQPGPDRARPEQAPAPQKAPAASAHEPPAQSLRDTPAGRPESQHPDRLQADDRQPDNGGPGGSASARPSGPAAGSATGGSSEVSFGARTERLAEQPIAMNSPAPAEARSAGGVPADWAALEARIQACEVCELHAGRQRAVAGSGAVEAVDWLVVGEAPGERDDRLGQPFQGKAGELLHAMLHAAGIDPARAIFYTNLVKCRPRSNRLPTPDEIAACLPHLHSQIALLRPGASSPWAAWPPMPCWAGKSRAARLRQNPRPPRSRRCEARSMPCRRTAATRSPSLSPTIPRRCCRAPSTRRPAGAT